MTIRNLDQMFAPQSVAIIGASKTPGTVGFTLARNIQSGSSDARIYFVNPKYAELSGERCYPDAGALPEAPQLAIIAVPPAAVSATIEALGKKGTRAAVVITAGLGPLTATMLSASRPFCLRVLGPNSLGLMLPNAGINASFAHRSAPKGDIAFLSQSGALVTTVVDWAAGRNIGFSHVVSLGDMADVDFGDLLDYFAGDSKSRAILIYMEALTNAPKFISAARRAARVKPVVVVKSGRHEAGARAAMSHTGALAGSDAAYDAAFRRAGLLRVKTLPDLFAAAEILARNPRLAGERLMILTNGGGAGVLAADELQDMNGVLAALSPETRAALDSVLPDTWSHSNPADIIGDAGPDRYRDALTALLADKNSDAILVMQCPTALAPPVSNAAAVVNTLTAARSAGQPVKPVLTCWLGDEAAKDSRTLFAAHSIPSFETPSDAIAGFMQLVDYSRAQTELMSTPPASPGPAEGAATASHQIRDALASGRTALTAIETKAVLKAQGIPVVETFVASSPAEVRQHAAAALTLSSACAVKILSPDISHKSDVGGVRLGLESVAAAEMAAQEMLIRAKQLRPEAKIAGFMVEPMIHRPNALEVIIGMSEDATFGPMILFGAGGTAVEVLADRALGLPPLDRHLARQMIRKTRISRLLDGYRDRPPANMDALTDVLVRVSDLIIANPEIRELDINPLLVDDAGIIALDQRMRIASSSACARRPLSIRPYPAEWEKIIRLDALGNVLLRPVRPDDEALYEAFFEHVTPDDMRLRFFAPHAHLSHKFLARLTQIDYAREMAFVALDASGELAGVARVVLDPDLLHGEFGILVRSDLKGRGLGWALMSHLIGYVRHEGAAVLHGTVLATNTTMIGMVRSLGFSVSPVAGDTTVFEVSLKLDGRAGC